MQAPQISDRASACAANLDRPYDTVRGARRRGACRALPVRRAGSDPKRARVKRRAEAGARPLANGSGHRQIDARRQHAARFDQAAIPLRGERGALRDWGHGCGECPACRLRKRGYEAFLAGEKVAQPV